MAKVDFPQLQSLGEHPAVRAALEREASFVRAREDATLALRHEQDLLDAAKEAAADALAEGRQPDRAAIAAAKARVEKAEGELELRIFAQKKTAASEIVMAEIRREAEAWLAAARDAAIIAHDKALREAAVTNMRLVEVAEVAYRLLGHDQRVIDAQSVTWRELFAEGGGVQATRIESWRRAVASYVKLPPS